MDGLSLLATRTELAAALLQTGVAAGFTTLCAFLYWRYRRPYLGWMAVAGTLYVVRLACILSFLVADDRRWLYWHQVFTGWTALALLWAACLFGGRRRWGPAILALAVFPPAWSYVAIYQLDHFLWAALPAVAFLSAATLWTGWVFLTYWRRVGGPGAFTLALALFLWGVHHLDYPFLRAQGAWTPWGYYLDVLFLLLTGLGILLLVVDELERGIRALSALAGELQRPGADEAGVADALLAKPLSLASVTGGALYLRTAEGGVRFVRGAGRCADWADAPADAPREAALAAAVTAGRPRVLEADRHHAGGRPAFLAVIPLFREREVTGALAIVGDARAPFTALDEEFLLSIGHHVGAALANADLYRRLELRTAELARLSARMVRQHEDERRRLSRELHDETAQVFSAVKMELGVLREGASAAEARHLDRLLELMDQGIGAVRRVTANLRPSLLDDLGLLPALRSLVAEFSGRGGLAVHLEAPAGLPPLAEDAELALFRALQEGLSNVTRHSGAREARVTVGADGRAVRVVVEDDGEGWPTGLSVDAAERRGHLGLAGMRERLAALGGTVAVGPAAGRGTRLVVTLPLRDTAAGDIA